MNPQLFFPDSATVHTFPVNPAYESEAISLNEAINSDVVKNPKLAYRNWSNRLTVRKESK